MTTNYEELDAYKLSENLSDKIWDIIIAWNNFKKDVLSKQLVKLPTASVQILPKVQGKAAFLTTKDI